MVIDLLGYIPMTVREIADRLCMSTTEAGVALRNAMIVRGEVVQDVKRDGLVTWRLRKETDPPAAKPKYYGKAKFVVLPQTYWDKVINVGDGQIKRGLMRLIDNA